MALRLDDPAKTPRLCYPVVAGGRPVAGDVRRGAAGPAVLSGGFVPGTGNIANGAVTDVVINAGFLDAAQSQPVARLEPCGARPA